MGDWKPIETAPKEYGHNILTWNGEYVGMAHDYHGWTLSQDADDMPMKPEPTHWQPLPEPPR